MSLKVLFCSCKGMGEKDIVYTLRKMGYDVDMFPYISKNFDYNKEFLDKFVKAMEKNKPDMVFSADFLPMVSKICRIFKCVYVSWVYDSPEIRLFSKAVANECNRIFIFDRTQYQYFKKYNPENIFYHPLATLPLAEEKMKSISKEERKRYNHDICFVGSLYNDDERDHKKIKNLPEYWRGYIEGLAEAQSNVSGYNMISDSLSDQSVEQLSDLLRYEMIDDYEKDDRYIISNLFIGAYASAKDREKTLRYLSDRLPVNLYTGEESDISMLPNIKNMGIADVDTMMAKIFHCCKINLNITSKTIQTGISLRVFDVLGSQGFLLTNYQEEILEYFEPGVDLVVYESIEDLCEKCVYYLDHEDERRQIALNGYNKVSKCYTYEIALKDMFDIIGIKR